MDIYLTQAQIDQITALKIADNTCGQYGTDHGFQGGQQKGQLRILVGQFGTFHGFLL